MEKEQRVFACPFYARSYKHHMGCRKYELRRIRDVKQHLWRQHLRRPLCARCYETFDSEEERDEHVRAQQCEVRAPVKIYGVSGDQQRILSRRSNSKHTVEEQWYFIWETLFPDVARPTSVYLDEMFSDEMVLLRRYMMTEGVAVIQNCLATHSSILWMAPGNEADLASFQQSVVRGVLEKLFEGMNDFMTGAVAQQSLAQANLTPWPRCNHESQNPELSGAAHMANTGSFLDQLPTGQTPPQNTKATGLTSFSEIGSAFEESAEPDQAESEFEHLFDTLRSEANVQGRNAIQCMNDQTSEFSFLST
ncbi:hypothetical protein F4802DRAFT_57299 [Xylaria palmicola]|nr:hypothetical protein F4802DRAFT_57299 [Xylaria palmicola]